MISVNSLLQWYRTQIPALIQLMPEEGIIAQLKDYNNLPPNLLDVYFQYRSHYQEWVNWDLAHIRADMEAQMDTDYYTPLLLVYLFQHSDISTTEATPRMQFSMSYVPTVVDALIFAKLNDLITQTDAINLALPYWMITIKKHAYLTDLYISNQFGDFGWLIDDDDEQATIVEDMDSATYLDLDRQTRWGYYLPSSLLSVSDISETARLRRHNIIIFEFAKRCAQRKIWDLETGFLISDPSKVPFSKMGKIAAQMLFQSLLWCRLNYAKAATLRRPSTLMGMISADEAEFIPFMYSSENPTQGGMIPAYELKTCQRISQWAKQIDPDPYPFALLKPYLGDGSLVSRVTLEIGDPGNHQDMIITGRYTNRYMYHLSYHMSSGLVPYWMSSYLRSLPRPLSPFLDTKYAGLIDLGPIMQNYNDVSKDLRFFSKLYVPITPDLYWSSQSSPNTMTRSNIKGIDTAEYKYVSTGNQPLRDADGTAASNHVVMRMIYPRKRTHKAYYPDCYMFSVNPDYDITAQPNFANTVEIPFDIK